MKKLAIFDLDGTLVDSIVSIAYTCNQALRACGLEERNIDEYKYFAGDGALELVKRAIFASGDTEYNKLDEVYTLYNDIYVKECAQNVVPFNNIEILLKELKKNGIKLAILSNKPHERALDLTYKVFGKDIFDIIIGYTDEETKKPNPHGALFIAKELEVLPEECIYIGDTYTDMKTGKNANMYTIGVTWGFRDEVELISSGADKIVRDPLEILENL